MADARLGDAARVAQPLRHHEEHACERALQDEVDLGLAVAAQGLVVHHVATPERLEGVLQTQDEGRVGAGAEEHLDGEAVGLVVGDDVFEGREARQLAGVLGKRRQARLHAGRHPGELGVLHGVEQRVDVLVVQVEGAAVVACLLAERAHGDGVHGLLGVEAKERLLKVGLRGVPSPVARILLACHGVPP